MYPLQVSEYSLHDFSVESSIHGLRHIFDRHKTFAGKCVWSAWAVISFVLCTILLVNVWQRWNADPMIGERKRLKRRVTNNLIAVRCKQFATMVVVYFQ